MKQMKLFAVSFIAIILVLFGMGCNETKGTNSSNSASSKVAMRSSSNNSQGENSSESNKEEDNEGANFVKITKVSLQQAVNTAFGRVKGKLLRAGLEKDSDILVYGVEIVNDNNAVTDVKVDAVNGNIHSVIQDKTENSESEDIENGNDNGTNEQADEQNDNENNEINEQNDNNDNEDESKSAISGTIPIGQSNESDYAKMAKITYQQAISTALTQANGKVLKVELENENNFLVYGVEIVSAKGLTTDVKIDAGNGNVLLTFTDHTDNNNNSDQEESNSESENGKDNND